MVGEEGGMVGVLSVGGFGGDVEEEGAGVGVAIFVVGSDSDGIVAGFYLEVGASDGASVVTGTITGGGAVFKN